MRDSRPTAVAAMILFGGWGGVYNLVGNNTVFTQWYYEFTKQHPYNIKKKGAGDIFIPIPPNNHVTRSNGIIIGTVIVQVFVFFPLEYRTRHEYDL